MLCFCMYFASTLFNTAKTFKVSLHNSQWYNTLNLSVWWHINTRLKHLYKWCLIFQTGVKEETGSMIQNILISHSSVLTDGIPEEQEVRWGKPSRSSKERRGGEGGRLTVWKSIQQFSESHQRSFPEIPYGWYISKIDEIDMNKETNIGSVANNPTQI